MNKKHPKKKKEIKITGLNIDKAEYQEIILSNSNHPNSAFLGKKKSIW